MAQTLVLIDDLTGGPADETLTFTIDGTTYNVDLNTSNASAFRSLVAPYAQAGRPSTAPSTAPTKGTKPTKPSKGTGTPRRSNTEEGNAIREWARNNGFTISARGRISEEIRNAYTAANPTTAPTEPATDPA